MRCITSRGPTACSACICSGTPCPCSKSSVSRLQRAHPRELVTRLMSCESLAQSEQPAQKLLLSDKEDPT